ncbi:hypothetical protein SLA2020_131630 [Shorea laevis]
MEDGKDVTKSSKPSPWANVRPPAVRPSADKSGKGTFPSKYCTNWRMLGLALGSECEQSNPSFNTNSTSFATKSIPNFGSLISRISPLCQNKNTRSSRIKSSASPCGSIGLLPQATSSKNALKANRSVLVVAFLVRVCSGARYPRVPTTCVVCGSVP